MSVDFPSFSTVVNLTAVGNPQHQDDKPVVLDGVDNSVIAHSHTPATPFATSEHRGPWWARLETEKFDGTSNS